METAGRADTLFPFKQILHFVQNDKPLSSWAFLGVGPPQERPFVGARLGMVSVEHPLGTHLLWNRPLMPPAGLLEYGSESTDPRNRERKS